LADDGGHYEHSALLYAGTDRFVDGVAPFVWAGVEAGEPTFVVVPQPKIDLLRGALGPAADRVLFADMTVVGRNPARIIPAWLAFIADHRGDTRVRGVGEPLYAEREPAERTECHVHEALLNLALVDAPLSLLCPYDTSALTPDDIEFAINNHPFVHADGRTSDNTNFGATVEWFGGDLPEPPRPTAPVEFELSTLARVRAVVDEQAQAFGLDDQRRRDCILAVSEIATNSLLHGGGRGSLRCWREEDRLVCEIADRGQINEPLVGRIRPARGQIGGYGMWLANQLADLVQIRSDSRRTRVRLHLRAT
jgi:anti-sigma regulatory factor (Ser/Thr protein kinase)